VKKLPQWHEVEIILSEIDDQLRADGYEIPQRPMNAVCRVSDRFHIPLPLVAKPLSGTDDNADAETLVARIYEWYSARYGDRLKLNPAPRSFALMLCGEPWRVRLPLMLAGVVVTAIRNPKVKSTESGIGRFDGKSKLLNLFDLVEDLPLTIRCQCSDEEQSSLEFLFHVAFELSNTLHWIEKVGMVASAIGDLESAVDKFFQQPKDLGGSRWASLQFVEKLLKSFVIVSGGKPGKKGHRLIEYAKQAEAHGLPSHPRKLYDAVQCDASVRYREVRVTLAEAIRAHHEALRLGCAVAKAIAVVADNSGVLPRRPIRA